MKRIIIAGCHRSGTTLMHYILNSHPQIHCFDEGHSYPNFEQDTCSETEILGFQMPSWTEFIVHSPEHKKHYKSDLILFMMRDVRGVIASMLTLNMPRPGDPDRSWFRGAVNGIQRWHKKPERGCSKEFFEELENTNNLSFPDHRKAAMFWRYKTSKYFDMVRMKWPIIPVFYEKLVQNPEPYLKVIFKFLEIDWNKCVLDNQIHSNSVYKWKEVLGEEEKAILETAGELNCYASAC